MPMRDIYKPALPYHAAQQEIEATPTGEGMQIPISTVPHDKALEEHSPQFEVERVAVVAGAQFTKRINMIPRSWAIYMNANSGAGALARIQSGQMDVTLSASNGIMFPGRTTEVLITAAVAIADVTIIALGDEKLRL